MPSEMAMAAVPPQSRVFLGVRFLLTGFRDEDRHRNVLVKLLEGGGVDCGRYGMNCTHVIVDGLVYDDPVCVAARKDGKTVVTGLWVDHSCDIGMVVDATAILYRPLKDMNGIPGAASLMVCLTGYQRQDRDDIMMMVRLMGAQFSKPLVAAKVTHLICYKFEGEKYELAKKMMKIKLVNHLWLEDCLRDWEILPETNYSRSGYELEMEAEAKDSEEEEEDKFLKPCQENLSKKSPILKLGIPRSSMSPVLKEHLVVSSPKGLTIADHEVTSNNEFPGLLVDGSKTIRSLTDADTAAELLPKASNLQKESPTGSGNADTPEPDAKFSTLSYSRRTSSRLVSPPGKDASANTDLTKLKFSRSIENVVNNSLTGAMDKIASSSHDVQTPSKTTDACNAEFKVKSALQGKNEVASAGCKVAKLCSSPSIGSEFEESGGTILMNKQVFTSSVTMGEMTGLHSAEPEKTHFSASDPRRSTMVPTHVDVDLPSMEITGFGSVADKDDSKSSSHTSPIVLPNSILGCKHTNQEIYCEQTAHPSYEMPVHPQLTDGLSLRDRETGITSAFDAAQVCLAEGEKNKAVGSTEREKISTKKTLGRKRNILSSANVKGSIHLTEGNIKSDNSSSHDLRQEEDFLDKSSHVDKTEISGLKGVIPVSEEVNDMMLNKEVRMPISHEMDDETQAPEETTEPYGENNENESHRVTLMKKSSACVEETTEGTDKAVQVSASDEMGKDPKENEAENPFQDQLLDGTKQLAQNLKNVKGSKRPLSNIKLKANRVEDNGNADLGSSSQIVKRNVIKKRNNHKSSVQVEKENQPRENSDSNGNKGRAQAVKSDGKKMSIRKECGEVNPSVTTAAEPACFIMSGLRQQRMHLRKLIRGFKGKLSMDSHRWSYQATHFVCAKPARTEKWFAACASGRWILQPEYVSASSQAGKLLDEEPYEWHEAEPNQDGAINLEAPRKWRLLRQRTGHGALYDMRIVIYGECISPPLETLKRAVKAGDGTILATSPPYTRFLNAKTDFAIISPGMPRVDAWIQEFIKHEIPCVAVDYLVEYVCKPGCSLEKHILFNTHSWAERSFSRLQAKAEEVVGLAATPNDKDGDSDICCNVCSSSNREEVILICGDEAGSVGCGTAVHIDCCDPPLDAVPKEDWLCPKCRIQVTKNVRTTAPAKKKRRSR